MIQLDSQTDSQQEKQHQQQQQQYKISLNKSLLKRLPNLSNLTIKNVPVTDIDSWIGKCKSLRNIELVNNNLKKLPADLFPITTDTNINTNVNNNNDEPPLSASNLTQIIVDNNPLVEIGSSLFCLESLRCIVLKRLSLEQLPDNWFGEHLPEIRVRMIHVAQTKLTRLPKDLIIYNSTSLEQLTFQG